jgi:hypothetical protein
MRRTAGNGSASGLQNVPLYRHAAAERARMRQRLTCPQNQPATLLVADRCTNWF